MSKFKVLAKKEAKIERFLRNQLTTLDDLGCHKDIIKKFAAGLDKVIPILMETTIPNGHFLALPIIPVSYLGIYGLANMARHNSKVCSVHLNAEEIEDDKNTPKDPYYALDIEDGTKNLRMSFNLAKKEIQNQKRFNSTIPELLSLAAHTNVLDHHNVIANGSRCGDDKVAGLWLNEVQPELVWYWANNSHARWGSASCGSRIEL